MASPMRSKRLIKKDAYKMADAQATGGEAVALWFPDRYGHLHLREGSFAEEAIVADAFPSRPGAGWVQSAILALFGRFFSMRRPGNVPLVEYR